MAKEALGRGNPGCGRAVPPKAEGGLRRPHRAAAFRHAGVLTVAFVLSVATLLAALDSVFLPPLDMDAAVTGSMGGGNPAVGMESEPVPAWLRIERPAAIFALTGAEFDGLERRYEAARHPEGGGRDDVLVFGAFGGGGAYLRLSAYRTGTEAPPPGTFFVDLVRRAGEAGLAVARSTLPAPVATKFGAMEVADAHLLAHGRERPCLAFRLISMNPGVRLTGWLCGSGERPVDKATFACLIDRFDLLTVEDRELSAWFASAEQRRGNGCVTPDMPGAGRRSIRLDPPQSAPRLKVGQAG